MSFDHAVSLFSALVAFAGLLFVGLQLRDSTRQRESESLVGILDVTRQLIALAFEHPQLFAVLEDKKADPTMERYYLQLWLNQFSMVYFYIKRSVFQDEAKENLERDVSDFMKMLNMRKHWEQQGVFYPASFQNYVNEILKKIEPPVAAAQVKSGN